MTTLRAHFDGRVIVPDEPVNLPTGRKLSLTVVEVPDIEVAHQYKDYPIIRHPVSGFPMFDVPADAKPFSLEDIREAEDEI